MKNKARLWGQCFLTIMLLILTGYTGESSMTNPPVPDIPDYAIVQVSAGENHSLGLKKDGTVVATGWNDWNQCDISVR